MMPKTKNGLFKFRKQFLPQASLETIQLLAHAQDLLEHAPYLRLQYALAIATSVGTAKMLVIKKPGRRSKIGKCARRINYVGVVRLGVHSLRPYPRRTHTQGPH